MNPIFMDPYLKGSPEAKPSPDPKWDAIRDAMGQTRRHAERMDLAAMIPRADLASSKFCLANPACEYLVYLPEGREVTVNLRGPATSFEVEWFDPVTGETRKARPLAGGGSVRVVSPLPSKDTVLHLKRSTP